MKSKKPIWTYSEDVNYSADNSDNNTFFKNVVTSSVVFLYVSAVWIISQKINQVQPIPYLDEIYHIPQAQEYCRGNFSYWDDRITTLPGLYLISVGIIRPLSYWTGYGLCETNHLRCINILISLFNLFLFFWIIRKINLQNEKNETNYWKELLSAFNVAIFPPLFFFSFLYYTDMAAACLVLLMYSLHLEGRDISAAAAGVVAIFCRQTSIVWTCLFALARIDIVLQHTLLSKKERSSQTIFSWKLPKVLIEKLIKTKSFTQFSQLGYKLIVHLWAYVVVGILFILFVLMNDGQLVVGDRNAHKATVNLPQLFYFFGLVVIFAAPHWLSQIQPFLKTCLMKWRAILLITALTAGVIRYNTVVHPYLLADNRHYTFYVWKRIYEYYPIGRYLVMPLYFFGAYTSYNTLVKKSFIFAVAFFAMSSIALVPQRLLEIRYFFIPFLLMRLHVPPRFWIPLILEFLMNIFLNAVTLYLFLTRPFYWADTDLVQRFMW